MAQIIGEGRDVAPALWTMGWRSVSEGVEQVSAAVEGKEQ